MPPEADNQTIETTAGTPATEAPATTDAGGGDPQSTASTPADTSNTTTGGEPTDLLSAVRAVLKPTAETSPAEGTGAGAPGTQPGDAPTGGNAGTNTDTTTSTTTDPPRDLTEADFADVEKPSVKKRLTTLIGQRAAARAE